MEVAAQSTSAPPAGSGFPPPSPRTSLRRLLTKHLPAEADLDAEVLSAAAQLGPADADNQLWRRRLYLVLDLDETLVYSSRLAPGAEPQGTVIHVRGQPFDMVQRPGLQHFLRMASGSYVVFLYTMGDLEYTHAVLRVIDPENRFFLGAPRTPTARPPPLPAPAIAPPPPPNTPPTRPPPVLAAPLSQGASARGGRARTGTTRA